MPKEKRATRGTFVAFVTFQILAALEAECGAKAGIEKFLPQQLPEMFAIPEDHGYE